MITRRRRSCEGTARRPAARTNRQSTVTPSEREILSLLLTDTGAFYAPGEIARHTGLEREEVKAALGNLVLHAHIDPAWFETKGLFGPISRPGWVVTDKGRDALGEVGP